MLHRVGLRTSRGRTRAVGGELVEDAGAGVLTGGGLVIRILTRFQTTSLAKRCQWCVFFHESQPRFLSVCAQNQGNSAGHAAIDRD